ncbi:MAG: histidine kinase [Arachnia sp.]
MEQLRHRSSSGGLSRRIVKDLGSMGDAARLGWYAVREVLTLIRWLAATVLSVLGIGRVEKVFGALRMNAERQRDWASEQLGRRLIAEYEPVRAPSKSTGLAPLGAQLQDRARARDLDWHLVNPIATAVGLIPPAVLTWYGLTMTLSALALLTPYGYAYDYFTFWVAGNYYVFRGNAAIFFALGAVQLGLAPIVARLIQRLHARWVSYMLATSSTASLEERVASLTETRRTALELQEAEIRRIERDLHDGAQARLVTMGMTLTQAQRLLEHDPEGASALLAAAKEDSSAALSELRSLVRGIRPPILADRGLVEAVRSLAAASPIDTRLVSSIEGRLVPTVETTLYFAIAELLSNAAKHSAATEVVIDLEADDRLVTARVTDNGLGGAREKADGGLAGLHKRLAPFDGELEFVSPVGGPTVATVRVPKPLE